MMSAVPKILIVDDEPIVRDTLEALLAAEDVELLFAENGLQGVRMAGRWADAGCQPG